MAGPHRGPRPVVSNPQRHPRNMCLKHESASARRCIFDLRALFRGHFEGVLVVTVAALQTRTATRPIALFVLGAQRSGTSMLTRLLSLCGGALPAGLMGADASNPLGYWEARKAIDINEAILYRHGSNWADPALRLQQEGAFDAKERAACIAEIRAFLCTLPTAPVVLIKEPRITMLSGMWFEAARQAGFGVAAVIAIRHPQEVAASLAAQGVTSPALANALWLKYSLLAERDTRDMPRAFVEYSNLLEDWRREIKRISATLAIDLNTRDESAIEQFLTPNLRHQRHCGPVTNFFGADWISEVYEVLGAATQDKPWDMGALDRVFEAYRRSEVDFRTAFDDFRSHYNNMFVRSVFRPSVSKRLREARTLVTRLSGPPH